MAADEMLPGCEKCPTCGAVRYKWKPGNWWRMVSPDGEVTVKAGREERVREEAKPGDTIQQVYLQLVERWQDEAAWPPRRRARPIRSVGEVEWACSEADPCWRWATFPVSMCSTHRAEFKTWLDEKAQSERAEVKR